MTQFKFTSESARQFNKHGIDLTVYDENIPEANVCHVSVDEGHFEEFYNKKSSFIYYIIEGQGIFFLNDQKVEAGPKDLVVIPPNTRVHYFGTMKMVLTVAPAFNEEDEVHVRFVDESENPYK